jgi:hypothetical protein
MTLTDNERAGSRQEWPRGPARRAARVMAGVAATGVLALALAACGGGNSGSSKIDLSVSSGAVGTVVNVSGHAGSGCVMDHNWFGFAFGRSGQVGKGPATQMAAPIITNGSWSASFAIPSYLGAASTADAGGAITAGKYEFSAHSCKGHTLATAAFNVTSITPSTKGSDYVGIAATVDGKGYWLAQADGTVTALGDAHSYGSLTSSQTSASKIVGIGRTYDGHGYWLLAANGHVFTLGDAHSYGSAADNAATQGPVIGMAVTPDGHGYWILTADGHVFGLGNAQLEGNPTQADAPFAGIATRPAGGYVVSTANNAAAYLFPGNVAELGGGPGTALSATLVGVAATPSGNGTWQTGLDGGVVTTGQTTSTYASYYGSVPGENEQLKAPVTAIAGSPDGAGYWLLSADGTVYTFGDAHFYGSGKS